MSEVWSTELTLPVQLLFTTTTAEGMMVDCLVVDGVFTGSGHLIPPGSPFSLLVEHHSGGSEMDRTMELLHRWVSSEAIVQATTSAESAWLMLQVDSDEVVLQIS